MGPALTSMSAKMGPISADITKYVRTREAATGVHAQGVIGPKDLEDPVLILTNVKTEILANMSVKIPLEATSVSAHPAIDSCSMGKHAKMSMSAWSRMCAVGRIACVST